MDYTSVLEVFNAQTENTRYAELALTHIKRTINTAYRGNDEVVADIQTKVFALTFSTWAEVKFSKLIHTPHGFSPDEIEQIKFKPNVKNGKSKRNLEEMWNKCIELSLAKVSASDKNSDIPNKRLKLIRIIKKFIIEPSLIRNKIAHGQWKRALNSENTSTNAETTGKIDGLDIVKVEKWIEVYKYLTDIIEDLIESPDKAHREYYWTHLDKLENYLHKTENWTLEGKLQRLRQKPLKTPKENPKI